MSQGAPAWPHGDPNAVMRSILAQPAYGAARAAQHQPPPPEPWWQVLLDKLNDALQPFFRWLDSLFTHASSTNAHPIAWIVLAILAAILAYAIVRIALAFAIAPLRKRRVATAGGELEIMIPSHLLHQAATLAAAGDFARAIVLLFSAALAALDERGIVSFDASRTAGEYRRLVRRARPVAAGPFDVLANGFVRALFAPAKPQRADYEAVLSAFAAFEPAVQQV